MKQIKYIYALTVLFTACKPAEFKDLKDGLYAEMQTSKGNVLLELYAENTPLTVSNFVSLAEGNNPKLPDSIKGKPYFDGIRFHRVVNNFIIQGGDPTETGRGTPGYKFGDEFPRDSVGELLYKHDDAGVLSMANPGPNSNGSQFFITHKPIPHLNGKHSVFGKTIVNPIVLKQLKASIKDSLKLAKSIDSLRLAVVNSIVKNDTIHTIKIIRIGDKAEGFKADKVFEEEFIKFNESENKRNADLIEADKVRYAKYLVDKKKFLSDMGEAKAIKTASGLRILKLKSTTGKKTVVNKPITVNYILHIANGKKIQSTYDNGGKPFTFQLDDAQRPMIAGFKEGVLTMKEGEKARLFIPYYIAYGEEKFGPFPAKADIVFEVEILKIGK